MNDTIARLRDRGSDLLLTALTVLLFVMLFVIAPLQASGIFLFQAFEFFFAIILIAGVFVMSGSRIAVVAMIVALTMATVGGILRLKSPSILDINLFAGAWLIMGIVMAWVVAPAVFGPGRITYHHIMGAILLYLTIAVIFVALFTFVGIGGAEGVFRPRGARQPGARQQPDLFQLCDPDHHGLRRYLPGPPDRAQPVQSGIDLRPALSRDAAGAAGDAGDRRTGVRVVNRHAAQIALARALRVTGLP